LKVIDTAQASYACDTTGTVTLLSGVATGTDFTNRIGRKVVFKSFLIQGLVNIQDNTVAANLSRVMIVYDTQPNGALPAVTDVLLASDATAPLNLNNRDRFRVLMDKRYVTGVTDNTATQAIADRTVAGPLVKYKKINLETIFDGTTAAIADIQSGSIFLLTIGTATAGAATILRATIRLRFNDA